MTVHVDRWPASSMFNQLSTYLENARCILQTQSIQKNTKTIPRLPCALFKPVNVYIGVHIRLDVCVCMSLSIDDGCTWETCLSDAYVIHNPSTTGVTYDCMIEVQNMLTLFRWDNISSQLLLRVTKKHSFKIFK